jgi:hypothetical protein
VLAKQRLLYRDYQMYRQDSADQIKKLKNAKNEEEAAREKADIRVTDLEKLVETLRSRGDGETRDALVNCQRTVTLLRVNEVTLKRKYTSLAEIETLLRKENSKLKVSL